MEPVQLMQWWAGVFDLGLFGGEAHGSSVLSTLLSSHKSYGDREGHQWQASFQNPTLTLTIFSTSSVSPFLTLGLK